MLGVLLVNLGILLAALLVLWLASVARRDASIVDPFWGLGFVLVAGATWLQTLSADERSLGPRAIALAVMAGVWGLRLSLFLSWRNWGHGEDYRYRAMRERHAARFWWVSLFTVFLLQGVILWTVAMPLQVGIGFDSGTPWRALDWIGAAVWLIGLFFESVGDWQLARFRADPANRGQVLDAGLWRYTRHPNYFGDCCVWWGLYLTAASGGAWWTLFSPLAMTWLLMKVSGVTLLEQTIADRRPEYRQYKLATNAFFPGPKRKQPAAPLDSSRDSSTD